MAKAERIEIAILPTATPSAMIMLLSSVTPDRRAAELPP